MWKVQKTLGALVLAGCGLTAAPLADIGDLAEAFVHTPDVQGSMIRLAAVTRHANDCGGKEKACDYYAS
jgi:hypothetical protein